MKGIRRQCPILRGPEWSGWGAQEQTRRDTRAHTDILLDVYQSLYLRLVSPLTPDFFHMPSPFPPAHEHRLRSLVGSTSSRSLSRHQITDWRVPSRSLWHITGGLPAEHRIHHSPPPATGTTTLNPQLVGPWTSFRDTWAPSSLKLPPLPCLTLALEPSTSLLLSTSTTLVLTLMEMEVSLEVAA